MAEVLGKGEFKTPKLEIKTNSKKERYEAMNRLIDGVQLGARQVESYLPGLLDAALEANIWSWPRQTVRQSGEIAGTSRNIVDQGGLMASKNVTTKYLKTKTTFSVSYSAPYATLVHEGGYIQPYGNPSAGLRSIPGRPWVSAVLEGGVNGVEALPLETIMTNNIQSKFQ